MSTHTNPQVSGLDEVTPDVGDEAATRDALVAAVADTQGQVNDLAREISDTERDLSEREASLSTLAAGIEAGEEVGPEAIPEQRRLIDHTKLILAGLRTRWGKAAESARLTRLRTLRDDIERGTAAEGDTLAQLAATAQEAQAALIRATRERHHRVAQWAAQLQAEGVGRYSGGIPEPSPAHGGLAISGEAIAVGALRVRTDVRPESLVSLVEHNAWRLANDRPDEVRTVTTSRTLPQPSPSARFFRDKESGAVEMYDGVAIPATFTGPGNRMEEITLREATRHWHNNAPTGQAVTFEQAQAAGR